MNSDSASDTTHCPGCGLEIVEQNAPPSDRYNASGECWQLFGELTSHTISKNDPEFVHQHCVDAYGAQHSGGKTKPITTVFSLVGLYLAVERDYTGRQVQQAHMTLGEQDENWPRLNPPSSSGEVTVREVLDANPGKERERTIKRWATSIWEDWDESQQWVRELCSEALELED